MMIQYYQKVLNLLSTFKVAKVEHIKRENNERVDLLAKLASTKKKKPLLLSHTNDSLSTKHSYQRGSHEY